MTWNLKSIFFYFSIAGFVALSSCADDKGAVEISGKEKTKVFTGVLEKMGGREAIDFASSIDYQSYVLNFPYELKPGPENGLVSEFNIAFSSDLHSMDNIRKEVGKTIYYNFDPVGISFSHTEVISGNQGSILGPDISMKALFFPPEGPEPMLATQITGVKKLALMGNPIALVKQILSKDQASSGEDSYTYFLDYDDPDIKLIIDPQTLMPVKSQTTEFDPLLGEVLLEVEFADWVNVGVMSYPEKITYYYGGEMIRTEEISDVRIGLSVDKTKFEVPTNLAFDEHQARVGYLSSQYFYMLAATGAGVYNAVTDVTITPVVEGGNAYMIGGNGVFHLSLAIEMQDYIIVGELPYNDSRSVAVINALSQKFSGKPIKYGIISHTHFDHAGGLRGYAANKTDLVVSSEGKLYVEGVLQTKFGIYEDELSKKPARVEVIGVRDKFIIGSGEERVEVYNFNCIHSEEMTCIYIPSLKVIYQNDAYISGFSSVFEMLPAAVKEPARSRAEGLHDLIKKYNLDVEIIFSGHGGPDSYDNFKIIAGE